VIFAEKIRNLLRSECGDDDIRVRAPAKIGYLICRLIMATIRLEVRGEEQIEATRSAYGGLILATWHGRTFMPVAHYRGRGFWAIISTSRDGCIQNRVFNLLGWNTVRGSTSARGAVAAALRMAKVLRGGAILAHTPDGPRGPSHVVYPGAIFLAEKSGCPILPAGVSANHAWYTSAWDRYMLPRPFARGVIIYGTPIHVPAHLDDDSRAELCLRLGREIERLEAEADAYVRATPPKISAATRTSPS
jgi:lysophospholipid acyltransferase (LPLAT)-like uncharacterized protein